MPVVASFYIGFDIDLYEFAKSMNVMYNRKNCYVKFEDDDVCMRLYPKGKALIWTSKDLAFLNDALKYWMAQIRQQFPAAQVINGEVLNTDGDTQPYTFAEFYSQRLPFNMILRVIKHEDDDWRMLDIRRDHFGKPSSYGIKLYFVEFYHIIGSLRKMMDCYIYDHIRQRDVTLIKISEDPLRWSIVVKKYQVKSDGERLYDYDKQEEIIVSSILSHNLLEFADEPFIHLHCSKCHDIYDYTSVPHFEDCECDCHLEYIPFPTKLNIIN